MSSHRNATYLPLLLLGSLLPAQAVGDKIAVLEGSRPDDLTLRVFDEASPAKAGAAFLDRLEILSIEITNRTVQMEFVPGRARLVQQQGWKHVELPGGGKFFHYRRRIGAAMEYGFLLITAAGQPVVVHAMPGVLPTGDPYEDRIGVAPDGRYAGLTTKAGAFFVARLDGGVFASTKAPGRRLALPFGVTVEPLAVAVGKTHVFFVTDDDRIRRCALADRNQPEDLTPRGAAGYRLKDELAPSGDGDAVAFLFGPKRLYSIYLLASSGSAVRLLPKPAKYEEPGYLPEFKGGPRLLLNHDGSRLLYVDATVRDEIYLLDTRGKTGATHITSDANFQPYIGVGILPSFIASSLVLAVGDPTKFDWFEATTASRAVRNLTHTGARKTAPFGTGLLLPFSSFVAGDGSLIAPERTANGTTRVRRVDRRTGASQLLVPALRGTPQMGAALGGRPAVLLPGRFGDTLMGLAPVPSVLAGPPGVHLSNEVVAQVGWYSVLTARAATTPVGGPALPVLHLHGVGIFVLPPEVALRQIVLTRRGGVLLNGGTLRYLGPGVPATVPGAPLIRVVVSGASQ